MPNLHTLHPDRQFTQISNDAADQLPSIHGLGYLVHLLRHRDGYVPNLDKLVEQKPAVTKRDASKARAEVMEHGFYVSVRFKHSAGGQFETDIWRSVYPHTAEDLDEIAQRYRPGNVTQIAQKDTGKKPQRDAHGNVLMRQVTIQWARVDSWRGKQRVGDDGQLCEPDTVKTDTAPAEAPRVRGAGSGNSARPAKTRVSPGGSEVPDSGGSGARGVGEREVYKKTRENTSKNTNGEHQPPPLRFGGCLWVTRPSVRYPSDARENSKPEAASTTGQDRALTDGTDGQVHEESGTEEPVRSRSTFAESLLADKQLHDDLVRIDLFPITKPVQRRQHAQLVKAIDAALLRFPETQVACYLHAKAREARGVTWLIGAFTDYADAIKQVHVPHQDRQDHRGEALLDTLAAQTDEPEQPGKDRAATERKADQLATHRQREQTPTDDVSSQVSPVSWLSDRQFTSLSAQDKAQLRAHGNTPVEQLSALAAKRIARIKTAANGVAA